jgi:hypothetical protein
MKALRVQMLILFLASLYLPVGTTYGQKSRDEAQNITVATVQSKAVTVTQQYACQIQNGTIPFRADFPNPKGLLRHGQTGNVLVKRVLSDAVVVPERATLEALSKRYVYMVDKAGIAHRREIVIRNELDGQFVIKTGVRAGDKIVLDGVSLVHDADKVQN